MTVPIRLEHQTNDQSLITVIDWNLGNVCNYSCSYCPPKLHDSSDRWPAFDVVVSFIDLVVRSLRNRNRKAFFQFSGGEPTLHPKFIQIVKHICDNFSSVGVISNGSRPIDWWQEVAAMLSYVCLTYHQEYAELRQFISVIDIVTKHCLHVHVNMPMIPDKFEECHKTALHIVSQYPDISLTLKPLLKDFEVTLYDYSADQLAILKNWNSRSSSKRHIAAHRGPMREVSSDGSNRIVSGSQLVVNQQNSWKGWYCHAGVEMISVTRKGKIYVANCRQGNSIGKIYDDKFQFPTKPIVCNNEKCACLSDIMISKSRNLTETSYEP